MRIRYSCSVFLKPVFTFLFILLPLIVLPQETSTCAENLKNAQALFEGGQVERVPEILRDCMKSGFTREEGLSAYKLLIQSFLFEDKLSQADSTMMEFLKKNPEYELSPTDHSSFVNLYNTFKVKPVIQISVHLGTNLPFITFIDQYSPMGIPGKNTYSSKALNLYASLEAKIELSEKLELNIEPGYSQVKFSNVEEIHSSQLTIFALSNYNETQHRIEVPLSLTYDIKSFGKFTPYGRFGAGPALVLGSSAQAESNPTDLNNPIDHQGTDVDRKKSRIGMDMFILAGAGIKLKTRGGYVLAEVRSNIGLLNQTIRGEESMDLPFFYFYTDDNFHVNTLNFSIGYTQIFYKPSKRKE